MPAMPYAQSSGALKKREGEGEGERERERERERDRDRDRECVSGRLSVVSFYSRHRNTEAPPPTKTQGGGPRIISEKH